MKEKIAQDPPATLGEAWTHGLQIGLEFNEARKQLREVIAHKVKVCRMSKKLTQEEISRQIEVNYLTYRGYENCKSDIPMVYLIRLADVFEVSLDYLTGRTDAKTAVEAPDMNARIEQLEKMVAKLTEMQSGTNE